MAKNTTDVPVQGHGLGQEGGDVKFTTSVIGGTLVVCVCFLGFQAGESAASTEETPRQVPTGGGNQHRLHHMHCRLPPPCARGGAPHVRARLPPPLPPRGGGGAEPMLPALSCSSAVKV